MTEGQSLLDRMTAYVRRFVSLPANLPGQDLVLALWAMHTWMMPHWAATPRLVITAPTKRAGKTLCCEVLMPLCQGAEMFSTIRPVMLVRAIDDTGGRVTLVLDEGEKLESNALGDTRSILASGYVPGGFHGISVGLGRRKYPTYAPVMINGINMINIMDVVRDRSIVVHLQRSIVGRENFRNPTIRAGALAEAKVILSQMAAYFQTVPAMVEPAFLDGRDQEIWTPLFSLAHALKLDAPTIRRLTACCMDLVGERDTPSSRTLANADVEERLAMQEWGARAVRDLARVLPAATERASGDVWSTVAVGSLLALPDAPWRGFKGVGLDENALARLVGVYGLGSDVVRMGKGRKAKQLHGYKASKVRMAAAKLLASLSPE